jgi:hypothetical protein
VIIPTFAIDREPQVTWATPVARKVIEPTTFRLSAQPKPPSMMNDSRKIERSASTSLPELPLNLPRFHSLTQS